MGFWFNTGSLTLGGCQQGGEYGQKTVPILFCSSAPPALRRQWHPEMSLNSLEARKVISLTCLALGSLTYAGHDSDLC